MRQQRDSSIVNWDIGSFDFQKCDHAKMYQKISDENLQLMRERLMETVVWPKDDPNAEETGNLWRIDHIIFTGFWMY